MRKSRTYGSVRGTPGNRRSYRDYGRSRMRYVSCVRGLNPLNCMSSLILCFNVFSVVHSPS
jgi:hypothetical protein